MIYKYHDGSGNTYLIKDDVKKTIEFIPIKPLYSSSGVYDGGNYTKKEINKLQYNKITSIINKAIKNKESHSKNRVKMSGMITIQEKNEKKTYILSPNSKELHEIEKILQNIIKN
ncbi:hypothetical protein LCGC14_1782560 [marine sediment metagenome]|uniref:Uncharacterized protein n=1 Tax=marine sediment metagenome TaxID=412755 RepID=A0A0F9J9V7_9ZZZZ